ncbi:hypothetical protein [Clostridium sp.]|uniref:hypothetical protein n=1 Tax=Clostridium sp. TaxID=1506 RepID=UPI00304D5BBC
MVKNKKLDNDYLDYMSKENQEILRQVYNEMQEDSMYYEEIDEGVEVSKENQEILRQVYNEIQEESMHYEEELDEPVQVKDEKLYKKVKLVYDEDIKLENIVKYYNQQFKDIGYEELAVKIRADKKYKKLNNKRKLISSIRSVRNTSRLCGFKVKIDVMEVFLECLKEPVSEENFYIINDLRENINHEINEIEPLNFSASEVSSQYLDYLCELEDLLDRLIDLEEYRTNYELVLELYDMIDTNFDRDINKKYPKKLNKNELILRKRYKSKGRTDSKEFIIAKINELREINKDIRNKDIAKILNKSQGYISKLDKIIKTRD